MNPTVALIFDVLILAALGGTIFYSFRLSKQFNDLHADRKAFEQLIAALNVSSAKAEGAIKGLKDAASQSVTQMQEKINAARELSDELEIMIQAGDNLAERLTKNASAKTAKAIAAPEDDDIPQANQPRTKAERDLMEALKAKQKT